MAQLTDLSDVLSRRTGFLSGNPENVFIFKTNNVPQTLGQTFGFKGSGWYDLWFYDGQPTTGKLPPNSGETCDDTTEGRIVITNPPAGQQKWLTNFNYTFPNANGVTMLYDRLCHIDGIFVTANTLQTITTPQLTRYSGQSSVGNRIILETSKRTTVSNAVTITLSYTNQDGVSGRLVQIPVATNNNFMYFATQAYLPSLVSGDTGVRSVETAQVTAGSITLAATGLTYSVAIIRPLEQSESMVTSANGYRDPIVGVPSFTEVLSGACLSLLFLNYTELTTSLNNISGSFGYVSFINK